MRRKKLFDSMKSQNDDEVIIKSSKKHHNKTIEDHSRGSEFKGVSKNGKSWQILMMIDKEKFYLGMLPD